MKSEPSEFGIDDLARSGESLWDGVRNYQVRNMFRDLMREGDRALFYHSNSDIIGVVGEMEIVKPAEVDPTQFKVGHKYFDPKATKESPRWFGPIVSYVRTFPRVVTLAELKADTQFQELPFVKRGNRLSVIPVTKAEYDAIVDRAKRK